MNSFPNQLNMSNLCVSSINAALKTAENLVNKAILHAEENKIKDETILNLRLIADMFPFLKQIQIVTDNAKGAIARLSGGVAPVFEDNETTLLQLLERLQKTKDYIASIDDKLIENTEEKEIILKFGDMSFPFVGYSYLVLYLLPNINFHLTTAYNILRSNGVKLGKSDYLMR